MCMDSKFIKLLIEQITMSFEAICDTYNDDFEKIAANIYDISSPKFDNFIKELAKSSKYELVAKDDKELNVEELVSCLIESTGSTLDAIAAIIKHLNM